MRDITRWGLLILGALFLAAIPTRLTDHDFAIGFPFTWHTHQEIVTFGPQPESFSVVFLLSDFALALLVLVVLRLAIKTRRR